MTLNFNLTERMFQMALLLLEDNNCTKLFWNPCINVQVMARTISIYDHFELFWPSWPWLSTYLKMFQMELFLFKDNNCAKLFWNPCINVQVMARTSSIYDHFDLYLAPVTLTFDLPEKCFKWHFSSSRTTTMPIFFWNLCLNVQVMGRTHECTNARTH